MKEIYLAGGCFWGVEEYFKQIKGVVATSVGYANGNSEDASYKTIGETNHSETVYIQYDESVVGLSFLLDMYYKIIDPTSVNKQGHDTGSQYRTGIYFTDNSDVDIINKSITKLEKEENIKSVIEIEALKHYVKAEDYHQDYLENNPGGYCHIGLSSFEEAKNVKPEREKYSVDQEELKKRLTPLQYEVTQNSATETPFDNEYWDNEEEGIYVDIVSNEPLFSSVDKFECGAGWAAFAKPLSPELLAEYEDRSLGRVRTEVKSSYASSHLGHVFDDGPTELGGMRYCINSASLLFVPKSQMKEKGFETFLKLFE